MGRHHRMLRFQAHSNPLTTRIGERPMSASTPAPLLVGTKEHRRSRAGARGGQPQQIDLFGDERRSALVTAPMWQELPVEPRTGDQGERGPAKHAPGAGPGKRVTGVGTRTEGRMVSVRSSVRDTQGRSRVPELGPLGSMRGASSNGRPYRELKTQPLDAKGLFSCRNHVQN
jgi:hypothetical protein